MITLTKLVARITGTENYFNGTAFTAKQSEALELRPGTTANDFKLMWSAPVEVIETPVQKHEDKYDLGREYVIKAHKRGQRDFSIRTANGKYISRKVCVEKTGPSRVAFIRFQGTTCAVALVRGELSL